MASLYYLAQYFSTTLNTGGGITNSQTTGIYIQSASGLDTSKPGIACFSWSDPLNTATAEWITYTSIDGSNQLVGVTRGAEGFSAKAHSNGATVVFPVSKSHINNINDKLTGVDTITLSDTSGNEFLKTSKTASAVNEITLANAATGNGPTLSSTGDDTNIDFNINTKGTGTLRVNGTSISSGNDGWTNSADTWVYASANSFTIAGVDRTSTYTKGTRIKCTNSTVKYFVVVASSYSTNTTVTITGGSDYSLANTTISSPYYSYEANPQSYPGQFNLSTPTWTASGTAFTNQPVNNSSFFSVIGNTCFLQILAQSHATSGGTGTFTATFTAGQLPPTTAGDSVGSATPISGTSAVSYGGICMIDGNANLVRIIKYDGTAIVGNGTYFTASIFYKF